MDTTRQRGPAWRMTAVALCCVASAQALAQPTQLIQFDTNEGTWMSLDVSPDGREIVFDLLGDLYTLKITGGDANRITSGAAFDAQPRYSPDGRSIVYTSDADGYQNVWLVAPDGSQPRQLTRDRNARYVSPEFTPDGTAVVVANGSFAEVYANRFPPFGTWQIDVTGSGRRELTAGLGLRSYLTRRPAFDANGALHVTIHEGARVGPEVTFPWCQIFRIDEQEIRTHPSVTTRESAFSPTFSPDGRWMTYGTRIDGKTALILRDLRAGTDVVLASDLDRDQQEAASDRDILPGHSFTPDSRALIAAFRGRIWRIEIPGGARSAIEFRAHVSVPVAPRVRFSNMVDDSPTAHARAITQATLTADGKRLAFRALGHVWVQTLPDGVPIKVSGFAASAHDPVWSSDGRSLIFATFSEKEGGHLYRVPVDLKRTPRQLTTEAAYYERPALSRDGKRIIVLRQPWEQRVSQNIFGQSFEGPRLHWLSSEGGATVEIPNATAAAVFDEHGAIVLYDRITRRESNMQGDGQQAAELVEQRLDGMGRHVLLKVWDRMSYNDWSAVYGNPGASMRDYAEIPATTVLPSPDGRHALVHSVRGRNLGRLYLVTMPGPQDSRDVSTVYPERTPGRVTLLDVPPAIEVSWQPDGSLLHVTGTTVRRYRTDGKLLNEHKVQLAFARDLAQGLLLLRGARIITQRDGKVLESGDILVKGHRILAVGMSGTLQVPTNTRTLNARGLTILPGFIDTHSHDHRVHRNGSTLPWWSYLQLLSRGITTSFEPALYSLDEADLVESGALLAPRLFGAAYYGQEIAPKSADELNRFVQAQSSSLRGVKVIKDFLFHRQQRQWLASAALANELTITAEGPGDMYLRLSEATDGIVGMEHSIPLSPLYEDVVQFLGRRQVIVAPTFNVMRGEGAPSSQYYYLSRTTPDILTDARGKRFVPDGYLQARTARIAYSFHERELVFPAYAKDAASLSKAGALFTAGGHGELPGWSNQWEIWALATAMSNQDALAAATSNAATAITLQTDLGSIEAGKLADLVLLKGNPLEDIRNTNTAVCVMKGGRLYRTETLEQVWPERKPAPDLWWRRLSPQSVDTDPAPPGAGDCDVAQ